MSVVKEIVNIVCVHVCMSVHVCVSVCMCVPVLGMQLYEHVGGSCVG